MASKVNTKFVVGLSASLLIVCAGVAGSAFFFLRKGAEQHIAMGDKKLAAGEMQDAVTAYGKAVNKEQTNTAFLAKWVGAMEKYAPENDAKFANQYREWIAGKRRLAVLRPGDLAPHLEYAKVRWKVLAPSFGRDAWDAFATELEESIATFTAPGSADKLKGYAGLARMRLALESPEVTAEAIAKPIELLLAGLAADPNNGEIANSLIFAHRYIAAKAEREKQPELRDAQLKLAAERIESILSTGPDNVGALAAKINDSLDRVRKQVSDSQGAFKPEEASRKFNEESRPLYDRMYNALLAKADLERGDIAQFRGIEMLLDGAALTKTEAVLREGLKKTPSSVELTIELAELLASRADYAKAEQEIARIAALPRLPIGNEGFALLQQRGPALGLQALWTVRVWESSAPGPERDAQLAKAKDLRAKLAEQVAPDNNVLRLVDAQLAFVENTTESNQKATQLLEKFSAETGGGNVDSLALTAQLAVRRNEPGKAITALRSLIDLQPFNITAMRAMLDLQMRVQDTEGAKMTARRVLALSPEDARAKQVLDVAGAMTGTTTSTDPVVRILTELDAFAKANATDPELDKKLRDRILALSEEQRQDARVVVALAQAHMRLGERAKAIEVLDAGIKKFPDSPILKAFRNAADADRPVQAQLLAIDANPDLSPLEKAIQRSATFAQFGDNVNADLELQKAEALDPNNRQVVDMKFTRLIAKGDLAAARPLVEQAIRQNLDGFQGDVFRARMLLGEGNPQQAAALMKQVADRGGAGPEFLRLQARILIAAGQPTEAADVLRKSLQARPNDPRVWSDLIEALRRAGKPTDALVAAREGRKYGEGDPAFLDAYLNIEAEAGDRGEALRQRERLSLINPGDRQNLVALAQLYLSVNQRDRAKATIDKAKAAPTTGDGSDLLVLEASWFAAANDMAGANKVFADFAAKTPKEKCSVMLYLVWAQFLLDRGFGDDAVAAAENGRPCQTKGVQEVDRYLSDIFARFNQTADMIKHSRAVVAENADTREQLYQKRVVEGLSQIGKFEEANTELAKLPAGDKMDVSTMLIAAGVKQGLKDSAAEGDLLGRAVSRFPTEPMAFLRRGQFFLRTGNERDALADVTKAIEIAPTNPTYLRERALMHRQLKDESAMYADLRSAARVAPQDSQAIFALLQELRRVGRDKEAEDVATEVQSLRKTDPSFANQLSDYFRSAGQYDFARDFSRRAYELDNNPFYTQAYLDVLLDGPAPNLAEVERVLTLAGDTATKNPGLLMARAKQRVAQNRRPDALRISQDACKLLNVERANEFSAWYNDFRKVVDKESDRFAALDQFARAGVAPEWMTFFRASEQLAVPASRDQALKDLTALQTSSKNNSVKYFVAKQLGGNYFQAQQYDKAAASWQAGLAVQPDDVEMLNNLAYTMIKFLGKPAEGLPLAERANTLNPMSPDIADTLGLAKLETGAVDDAIVHFEQARRSATNVSTLVQASIHLMDAHMRKGDKAKAKEVLATLDQAIAAVPADAMASSKTELDAMRSKVEAP